MRSPFETQSLIDWLEKQPPEEIYDYCDTGNCLLARYYRSVGFTNALVTPYSVILDGDHLDESKRLPEGWNEIAFGMTGSRSRTFAAALQRARNVLAKELANA